MNLKVWLTYPEVHMNLHCSHFKDNGYFVKIILWWFSQYAGTVNFERALKTLRPFISIILINISLWRNTANILSFLLLILEKIIKDELFTPFVPQLTSPHGWLSLNLLFLRTFPWVGISFCLPGEPISFHKIN